MRRTLFRTASELFEVCHEEEPGWCQLMIQQVLAEQAWLDRMPPDDWRALTPLIYAHINPYGTFELDMQKRLHLEAA